MYNSLFTTWFIIRCVNHSQDTVFGLDRKWVLVCIFCAGSHLLCHAASHLKGGLEWTICHCLCTAFKLYVYCVVYSIILPNMLCNLFLFFLLPKSHKISIHTHITYIHTQQFVYGSCYPQLLYLIAAGSPQGNPFVCVRALYVLITSILTSHQLRYS